MWSNAMSKDSKKDLQTYVDYWKTEKGIYLSEAMFILEGLEEWERVKFTQDFNELEKFYYKYQMNSL